MKIRLWNWEGVKKGFVPFLFLAALVYVFTKIFAFIKSYSESKFLLHLTGNIYLDCLFNLAGLLILFSFIIRLLGYLKENPSFQKLIKENAQAIPFVGGLIVLFLGPRLKLVLVRPSWAPTPKDENWEYGYETIKSWKDKKGNIWHRVHTLSGTNSRIIPQVGDNNIKSANCSEAEALLIVLTMGLYDKSKKGKSKADSPK